MKDVALLSWERGAGEAMGLRAGRLVGRLVRKIRRRGKRRRRVRERYRRFWVIMVTDVEEEAEEDVVEVAAFKGLGLAMRAATSLSWVWTQSGDSEDG